MHRQTGPTEEANVVDKHNVSTPWAKSLSAVRDGAGGRRWAAV